jgi:hypothetical protein
MGFLLKRPPSPDPTSGNGGKLKLGGESLLTVMFVQTDGLNWPVTTWKAGVVVVGTGTEVVPGVTVTGVGVVVGVVVVVGGGGVVLGHSLVPNATIKQVW